MKRVQNVNLFLDFFFSFKGCTYSLSTDYLAFLELYSLHNAYLM